MSDHKLEVTKEDLNAEARKLARYQFAMYGLNNVPEEHLNGYAATSRAAASPRRLRRTSCWHLSARPSP